MPSAQDRDELDAQDPFAPRGSDRGYRIGARLEAPRDRRPHLVASAIGTVLVAAIAIAALGLRVDVTAAPSTPAPLPSFEGGPIPTRLPALAFLGDSRPTTPFPVLSGGLRWLDAQTGTISGPPLSSARGWIFDGSDGRAICVCYDSPWSQSGIVERITIVRYEPSGLASSRTVVEELTSPVASGDAILRDVARSADGADLYVASTIRDATGWTIRLDRVALGAVPRVVARVSLGTIEPATGGTLVLAPIVRVSPDGRWVRIAIRSSARELAGGRPDWIERAWLVPTGEEPTSGEQATLGPARELRSVGPVADPDRCDAEAWATANDYVVLCRETSGESLVPRAHITSLDGTTRDVQVGDPIGSDDLDWLLDARAGVVYRWSRFSHVIARLDVRTGTVAARSFDISGPAPWDIPPDADLPATYADRAIWSLLVSADSIGLHRLAGSADGSLLYAVGVRSGQGSRPSGPVLASTGIWVFDAATLGLVGHWPAAAMYDQVGTTPDGRYVLAVGLEGMNADGRLADWSSSMAIHDAPSGQLVELVGSLVGDEGFFVDLLVPGPGP